MKLYLYDNTVRNTRTSTRGFDVSEKRGMKILVVRRVRVSPRTAARPPDTRPKSATRGPFMDREGSSLRERERYERHDRGRERERRRGGRLVNLRGPDGKGDAIGTQGAMRSTHGKSRRSKRTSAHATKLGGGKTGEALSYDRREDRAFNLFACHQPFARRPVSDGD